MNVANIPSVVNKRMKAVIIYTQTSSKSKLIDSASEGPRATEDMPSQTFQKNVRGSPPKMKSTLAPSF